jgi:UPF0755 protein
MRNEGRWLIVLALITIGLVTVLAAWGWHRLQAAPEIPDGGGEPVEFRVSPGEGFASVSSRLADGGLVVSAARFETLARLLGADRDVQAGTYLFAPGTPPRDLLGDLVAGSVRLLRFTVPEGWRLDQIADEAEGALGIPRELFLAAASDPDRKEVLGSRAENLEGYLFPETYRLPDDVTAGELVDAMTGRFVAVWDSLKGDPPPELDRHDVVTLASIVEAETSRPDERPRIAAVYLNRLERGWKLQADPTVRYALGRFRGRLYYKHLRVDSPYNTYREAGLPPGPIAAPGRAALQAVLQPLSPCDDMYFVASGDGGHVFSRTKQDHDRAKQRARSP